MIKRVIIAALSLFSIAAFAGTSAIYLMSAQTSTGAATAVSFYPGNTVRTHQFSLNGASAVSATVTVSCSNDGIQFSQIMSASLTAASSTFVQPVQETCAQEQANLTAISGVGASVTVTVGE